MWVDVETLWSKITGGSVSSGAGDKEGASSINENVMFKAWWNITYSPESSTTSGIKRRCAGEGNPKWGKFQVR